MRRPAGPPPGQYGTPRPFGDPAGVGHGPGHGSRGDLRHDDYGDYGDYGDYDDHGGSGAAERSGKRRADVTAVDLGYTGRRHYDDEDDFGLGPDENTGYTDYGAPAPDQYGRTRY
jgi:hypothetical protein